MCLLFVAFDFHNFCCCAHISFATVFTFFLPLLSQFCCCFDIYLAAVFFSDALWKLDFPLTFFGQSLKLSAKNYGSEG